jgi:hypothetical protein
VVALISDAVILVAQIAVAVRFEAEMLVPVIVMPYTFPPEWVPADTVVPHKEVAVMVVAVKVAPA